MERRKDPRAVYRELGPYMAMGGQLALSMVGFGAIGYYADIQCGTHPWLLLAGLLLGATGGMIKLIRTSLKAPVTSKRADDTK